MESYELETLLLSYAGYQQKYKTENVMDYRRIYYELIAGTLKRPETISGYSEAHHINPVAHGGIDGPTNLVDLTYREHFVAHWLLYRIHRDIPTARAFNFMASANGGKRDYTPSQTAKDEARKALSNALLKQQLSDDEKKKFVKSIKRGKREARRQREIKHKLTSAFHAGESIDPVVDALVKKYNSVQWIKHEIEQGQEAEAWLCISVKTTASRAKYKIQKTAQTNLN